MAGPPIDPDDPELVALSEQIKRKIDEFRTGPAEGRVIKTHQVAPYLVVRMVLGDRGGRPVSPWVPFWESPDILINPADAPPDKCDLDRLVVSPVVGREYRIWVRVWNLGRMPASGVLVTGWLLDPGFIGGGDPGSAAFQDGLVGNGMTDLGDRRRADCMGLVPLSPTWKVAADTKAHSCLIVRATTMLDAGGGELLADRDRHVAQRNLAVLGGEQEVLPLFSEHLVLPEQTRYVQLLHAGPGVAAVVEATTNRRNLELTDSISDEIAVHTDDHTHLALVVIDEEGRSLAVPAVRAWTRWLRDEFSDDTEVLDHPEAVLRAVDRLGGLDALGEQLGVEVPDRSPLEALALDGLGRLYSDGLPGDARHAAEYLGGDERWHGLRLVAYDRGGELIGGYTVVIGPDQLP